MHEQARAHYDMGTGAYVRADYKTAAQEFALADRMSPSAVALSAALDAAIQAELAPLAMELVQRSTRGPVDAPLAALVSKARARFSKRVGRVKVTCAAPCSAKLDGAPIELDADQFAWVGKHTVTLDRPGGASERPVDVTPEGRAEIVATDGPTPTPTPTPTSDSGISPVFFFTGVGLSAVLGAVAIASGVDTARKHDDYFTAKCDTQPPTNPFCAGKSADGISAQHRTNLFIGISAAAAVTTAVIGIFFTRWHSSVSAQVVGSAATAQLRVDLP